MKMRGHRRDQINMFSMTTMFFIICLLLFSCLLLLGVAEAQETEEAAASTDAPGGEEEEEVEPVTAVLFPWFSIAIGTFVYFFLTRFMNWMPYTAVMFLVGTAIGAATARLDNNNNILNQSVQKYWVEIDSEVMLLIFLPGLVSYDALTMDWHVFQAAFWQCINFAFPMVLANAVLTALFAHYVFPYNWSFYFAMMFGSILSATDPVAVTSLLDSLGAPPRLKVHISGESLLNDGSSIVFYTIFSNMYLLELGIPGLGRSYSVGEGFAIFFRMSLGAMASGLFFGFGTLIISRLLKRRLEPEENVVEVATILTMAYLTYFTTDVVWKCSGVIGTLTYGLVLNAYDHYTINDTKLLNDFWSLVEHTLTTVLFTLGGLAWGDVIANDNERNPLRLFTGQDWGYLFALYCFLMVARYFLIFAWFPLTNHTGLKTCWQEAVFEGFAGLRGAVGISLALAIDNLVQGTEDVDQSAQTSKLFGFIGGVTFLTLVINATLAGPLLHKLGLANVPVIRKKVTAVVYARLREKVIYHMVSLLSQKRFRNVTFEVVAKHVPIIADLKKDELAKAVKKFQAVHSSELHYRNPEVKNVLPYLQVGDGDKSGGDSEIDGLFQSLEEEEEDIEEEEEEDIEEEVEEVIGGDKHDSELGGATTDKKTEKGSPLTDVEARQLFLELLKSAYTYLVESGELHSQEYLVTNLNKSIEFAANDVNHGMPLTDWKYTTVVLNPAPHVAHRMRVRLTNRNHLKYVNMKIDIQRCMAFLEGHRLALRQFLDEFVGDSEELTPAEQAVVDEVEAESKEAEQLRDSYPAGCVQMVASIQFSVTLLNKSVSDVEHMVEIGLLTAVEATDYLHRAQEQLLELGKSQSLNDPEFAKEQPSRVIEA